MELFDGFMHGAPLVVVAILLFAAMVVMRELGAWIHARVARGKADKETSDEGYILSAVLGLLALLVAFTFGLALDRHETRRNLVVTEANALGTAYLRADLAQDPARLQGLIRRYAAERLAYGRSSGDDMAAADKRGLALQAALWNEAIMQTRPLTQTAMPNFLLSPLNEAFDAATTRRAELDARLPDSVLAVLVLYVVVSAGVLGYAVAGAGERHRAISMVLFGLISLAIALILDLDRPRSGMIRVAQGAMAEVYAGMKP